MPWGIIPNEDKDFLASLFGLSEQANNDPPHLFTVGVALSKVDEDFFGLLAQRPKTSDSLVRGASFEGLLNQFEGMRGV